MDISSSSQLRDIQQRCFSLYRVLSEPLEGGKPRPTAEVEQSLQQNDSGDDDNSNHSFASSVQQSSSYDLAEKFSEIRNLATLFSISWDKDSQEKFAKALNCFVKQIETAELVKVYFANSKAISMKIFRITNSNSAQAQAVRTLSEMFSRLKFYDSSSILTGEDEEDENVSQNQDSPSKRQVMTSLSSQRPRLTEDVASLHKLFFDQIAQTKQPTNAVLIALLDMVTTLADSVPPEEFTSGKSFELDNYINYIVKVLRSKSRDEKIEWGIVAACLRTISTLLLHFPDQLVKFSQLNYSRDLLISIVAILEKTKGTELHESATSTVATRYSKTGKKKAARPNYRQINSTSAVVTALFNFLADFGAVIFDRYLLLEPALSTILDCVTNLIWAKRKEVNASAIKAMEALCLNAGQQLSSSETVATMSEEDRHKALNKHLSCLMTILSDHRRSRSHHNSLALGCYGHLAQAWLTGSSSDYSLSMDGTQQRVEHAALVSDLISTLTKFSLTSTEEEEKGDDLEGSNDAENVLRRLLTLMKLIRSLPKKLDALMFNHFSKLFLREVGLFLEAPSLSPEHLAKLADLVKQAVDTLDERQMQNEADRLLKNLILSSGASEKLGLIFAEVAFQPFSRRLNVILMRQVNLFLENINYLATKSGDDEEKINSLSHLVVILETTSRRALIKCPGSMFLLISALLQSPCSRQLRTCLYRLLAILFSSDCKEMLALQCELIRNVLHWLQHWKLIALKQELLALCKCFFSIPFEEINKKENVADVRLIITNLCDIADDQLIAAGEGSAVKLVNSGTIALIRQALDWLESSSETLLPQFENEIATKFLCQIIARYSSWLTSEDETRLVQLFAKFSPTSFRHHHQEEQAKMMALFEQLDLKLGDVISLKWADLLPTSYSRLNSKMSRVVLQQIESFLATTTGGDNFDPTLFVDFFNNLVQHSSGQQLAGQVLNLLLKDESRLLLEPCLLATVKSCSLSSGLPPFESSVMPEIVDILRRFMAPTQNNDPELKTKSLWLISQAPNSVSYQLVTDALLACDQESDIVHCHARRLSVLRLAESFSPDSDQISDLFSKLANDNGSPLFSSTCLEVLRGWNVGPMSLPSVFLTNVDRLFSILTLKLIEPNSNADDYIAIIRRLVDDLELESSKFSIDSVSKLCCSLVALRNHFDNFDEEFALKLATIVCDFILDRQTDQPVDCYKLILSLCHLSGSFSAVKQLLSRQIPTFLSSNATFLAHTLCLTAGITSSSEVVTGILGEYDDELAQIALASCQENDFVQFVNSLFSSSDKNDAVTNSRVLLFNRCQDLAELLLTRIRQHSINPSQVVQFLAGLFESAGPWNQYDLPKCFLPLFAEICSQIPVGRSPDYELVLSLLATVAKAGFSIDGPSGVDVASLSKVILWISSFCGTYNSRPKETTTLTFFSAMSLFGPQLSSFDTGPLRISLGQFIDRNALRLNNEAAANPANCSLSLAFTNALVANNRCVATWFLREVLSLIVFNSQWACERFLDKAIILLKRLPPERASLNPQFYCIREVLNGLAVSKDKTSSTKLWHSTFDQAFYFCSKLIENKSLQPALFLYLEENGAELNRAVCDLVSATSINTNCCDLVNRGLVAIAVLNALFDDLTIANKVPEKCHKGLPMACFDFRRLPPNYLQQGDLYDLYVYLQQRVFALLSSILRAKRPEAIEKVILLEEPENCWKMLIGGSTSFFPQKFGLEKNDDDEQEEQITRHPVFLPFLRSVQCFPVKDDECPKWLANMVFRITQIGDDSLAVAQFLIRLLIASSEHLAKVDLGRFVFELLAKVVITSQRLLPSPVQLNYVIVDIFDALIKWIKPTSINLVDTILVSMTQKVCATIQYVTNAHVLATTPTTTVNISQVKNQVHHVTDQLIEAAKRWRPDFSKQVPRDFFDLLEPSNVPSCYLALRIVLALVDNGYTIPDTLESVVWPLLYPPNWFGKGAVNLLEPIFGKGIWPYVLPYHYVARTWKISTQPFPNEQQTTMVSALKSWLSVKSETCAEILLLLSDYCSQEQLLKTDFCDFLEKTFLITSLSLANFKGNQAQALEFIAVIGAQPNEVVSRAVEQFKKLAPPSKSRAALLPVWGHLLCACMSSFSQHSADEQQHFLSSENLDLLLTSDYAIKPALGSNCFEIRLLSYRLLCQLVSQQAEHARGEVNEQLSAAVLKALGDPSDLVFDENLAFWSVFVDRQQSPNLSYWPSLVSRRLVSFLETVVCKHKLSRYPSLVLPALACSCLDTIIGRENEQKLLSHVDILLRLSALHFSQTTAAGSSLVAMKRWQQPQLANVIKTTVHSVGIETFRSVLRRDETTAARFICGLIKAELSNSTTSQASKDLLRTNLSQCFDSCLHQVKDRRRSELLISTFFSIIYSCQIDVIDWNVITHAAISSGHQDGAIALLEASFCPTSVLSPRIPDQSHRHETKRRRVVENEADPVFKAKLGCLIRLYRVAGDFDSAYGLAKSVAPSSTALIEGLEAEANNSWRAALAYYESAVSSFANSSICSKSVKMEQEEVSEYAWQDELVLSGKMACLARLGQWNDLKTQATIIPQRLGSHNQSFSVTASLISGGSSSLFFDPSLIRSSSSSLVCEALSYLGLAQSLLLIKGDEEGSGANEILNSVYQQFVGGGSTSGSSLHPKYGIPLGAWYAVSGSRQRATTLLTSAAHSLLPVVASGSGVVELDRLKLMATTQNLLNPTQNNTAISMSKSSDLPLWNAMVTLRESFSGNESDAVLFKLKLQRIGALVHQGVFDVAMTELESLYKSNVGLMKNEPTLGLDFTLTYAEAHLAPLRIERLLVDNAAKLAGILPKVAGELLKKKHFVNNCNQESRFHRLLARTFDCAELLPDSENTLNQIADVFKSDGKPVVTLCSQLLEKAAETGNDLEAACQFLRFAVRHSFDAVSFAPVVRLYLASLCANSSALNLTNTCLYLPMLLHPLSKFENDDEILEEFGNGLDRLVGACSSPDVLAPWLSYLLHGSSRFIESARPALERFCTRYPHRSAYSLCFDSNLNTISNKLWSLVNNLAPSTCSFIKAIHSFRSPGELLRQLKTDSANEAMSLLQYPTKWPQFFRESAQKAADGLKQLFENGANFQSSEMDDLISCCDALPPLGPLELSNASPWFCQTPQSPFYLPWHGDVAVSQVDPIATVLPSLRRPIRMTVRLENGKLASLLIKAGEDLRQDEHVQLMTLTMAALLSSQLLARSFYAVCPLSSCLGLLQWVEGAQPLADLALKPLNEAKRSDLRRKADATLLDFCNTHIEGTKASGNLTLANYSQLAGRAAKSKRIRRKLAEMQIVRENALPSNALRQTLLNSLPDASSSHRCRIQLLDSYAANSLCHYLLGIGDRHLKNVLVVPSSAVFVGVDFSYAFGMATSQLAVPELVPFRLTRQISTLFWPCEQGRFVRQLAGCIKSLLTTSSDMALNASMAMFVERFNSNSEASILGVSQRLHLSPFAIFSHLLTKNKNLNRSTVTVNGCQQNGDGVWRRFLQTAFEDPSEYIGEISQQNDDDEDDSQETEFPAPAIGTQQQVCIKLEPLPTLPLSTVLSSSSSSSQSLLPTATAESQQLLEQLHEAVKLPPNELAEALLRLSTNRAVLGVAYSGWQSYI